MPDTVRTFIALPIAASPPLRKILRQLGGLGRTVKAIDPEQLHVTLNFLGETPWTSLPQVTSFLAQAASGHAACEGELIGLGGFPDSAHPRVVWSNLLPPEPLTSIAAALNDRLSGLGFPRDNRPFVPHVTLARVKGRCPAELSALLESSADVKFGGIPIDRLVLYQSELTPTGPRYTVLSEQDLA